jgi:peptide/nickel transport system substrate-binding protein
MRHLTSRRVKFLVTFIIALTMLISTVPLSAQDGGGYIGELEGPTLVLNPAQWPTEFAEAPMLAEKVAAGELPAVEERLPEDLLVIQPLDVIGEYGGTWRRAFVGPGDGENGNRINCSDKLLFWDYTGTEIVPSAAKGWEVSDDGLTTTVYLRKGMKWSDGEPFTADDFVFWFEWMYSDSRITTPIADMAVNGQQGKVEKVDDYTVNFVFPEPNLLFVDLLAGDTLIGGGQSVRQSRGTSYGAYAPAHYLSQFIPEVSGKTEEELNAEAQDAGFEDWVTRLHFATDWQLNPDVPNIGPFRTVQPINTEAWVIERNPYYWAVDTAGNQLPYLDRVVFTLAESPAIITLRAIAGEYDQQERHILMTELPAIIENQETSNYTLHLDLAFNGSDAVYQINQSYDADPEIAKWLTNTDFRRALSLGIDRDQLNETFWLGAGIPGSVVPAESSPYNPGSEYRDMWSTYDPEQANEMLDAIGLTERDSEGFRVRTDNGERLRLEIQAVASFLPYVQISEMVANQWADIGIYAEPREYERTLGMTRAANNETQIFVWTNGGTELLYLFPRHAIPVDPTEAFMGPAFAKWFVTNGAEGKEPTDPNILRIYDLFTEATGLPEEGRIKNAQEIWKILVDQQYGIGTVGQSPAFMGVRIVTNDFGNIPDRTCIAQHCRTPGGSHPETFYFTNPDRRD